MKPMCAFALAAAMLSTMAAAAAAPLRVVVLPFTAHSLGMNDEVLATRAQLNGLERAFVANLRERGIDAIEASGNCAAEDEECYRSAARSAGAKIAVSAAVTRYMALIWGVDVAVHGTSASSGTLRNEYKGDYDALLRTMPEIASQVKRSLL